MEGNTIGSSAAETLYRNLSDDELIQEYAHTPLEDELQERLLAALRYVDELEKELKEMQVGLFD